MSFASFDGTSQRGVDNGAEYYSDEDPGSQVEVESLISVLQDFKPNMKNKRRGRPPRTVVSSRPSNSGSDPIDNMKLLMKMIHELTLEVRNTNAKIDALSERLNGLDLRIGDLESKQVISSRQFSRLSQRLDEVEIRMDDCEQRDRKLNMVLYGESFDSSLDSASEDIVGFLKEKIGLSPEEVTGVSLSKLGKGHKTFLLRVRSFELKSKLFREFKRVKPRGVYLNESLIPSRANIFRVLRERKKLGLINSTYSFGGMVYCRVESNSEPFVVNHINQIPPADDMRRV